MGIIGRNRQVSGTSAFKKARQSKKWVNFTSFVDDSIKDIPLLITEIKG